MTARAIHQLLTLTDPIGDCRVWRGSREPSGHGRIWVDGRHERVHRFAYETLVGPIPDGLTLDHLCHSRSGDCVGGPTCHHRLCVNPAHLEPVTAQENARRQWSARKPQCKSGHPFDELNTYIRPSGHRDCRACIRDRVSAYKARKARAAA